MATVYVVWDRKNQCVIPGSPHPNLTDANNAISKRKLKDARNKLEENKVYDAVAVNV